MKPVTNGSGPREDNKDEGGATAGCAAGGVAEDRDGGGPGGENGLVASDGPRDSTPNVGAAPGSRGGRGCGDTLGDGDRETEEPEEKREPGEVEDTTTGEGLVEGATTRRWCADGMANSRGTGAAAAVGGTAGGGKNTPSRCRSCKEHGAGTAGGGKNTTPPNRSCTEHGTVRQAEGRINRHKCRGSRKEIHGKEYNFVTLPRLLQRAIGKSLKTQYCCGLTKLSSCAVKR